MSARYLSAREIAEELGVSRSRGYEIATECTRIVTGRTVRVSRDALEAWKKRHEVAGRDADAMSVFANAPAMVGGRVAARRAVAASPHRSPGGMTSEELVSRPIVPRTRPLVPGKGRQ